MVRLTAPNGVLVEASDAAAPLLLANGYARADEPKGDEPKAAPKRAAKKKK